jgi:Uma2 family endonuclease
MAGLITDVKTPPLELIYDDGEPMDSDWHRIQMNLLIELIEQAMRERDRGDYFAGGNMFIYYSVDQARAVATLPPESTLHFRGPDVFWVGGVAQRPERRAWVVWNEAGRYPDLIVELLSPSTARIDRTTKKEIYERTFRTPDYFMYDREGDRIEGFHLVDGNYRSVAPDARGRCRVDSLDLWIGLWHGRRHRIDTTWLRLFDASGRMIPSEEERLDAERTRADGERTRADAERARADAEKARADAEKARADSALAELARLRGRIADTGPGGD